MTKKEMEAKLKLCERVAGVLEDAHAAARCLLRKPGDEELVLIIEGRVATALKLLTA